MVYQYFKVTMKTYFIPTYWINTTMSKPLSHLLTKLRQVQA